MLLFGVTRLSCGSSGARGEGLELPVLLLLLLGSVSSFSLLLLPLSWLGVMCAS